MHELGTVASGGAEGARLKADRAATASALPLAQGKQVMRSPCGANAMHSAMDMPMLGTKLSEKVSTKKTSHSSHPMAQSVIACADATRQESASLPRMYT